MGRKLVKTRKKLHHLRHPEASSAGDVAPQATA
jgi:hypothetical protein